jgi:hypothetical protein
MLEVDFKDRTAEVYDATGKMTRVRFPEGMAEQVKAASRMQVIALGESEVDDHGRVRSFDIEDLAVSDDIPDDFWMDPSLEELIRRQDVRPITSVRDFVAASFSEEEVDDILSDLRGLRL